jgi:two-component system, OmpR family, sensor kinase
VSLRARLLITSVVLVAAGLLVANVATYRLLSNFLLNRVDDQLVAAQGPILDSLQFEGDIPDHPTPTFLVPPGTYAEVRNGSGAPLVWKFFGYESEADQRPVCPRNLPGSTSSPTQGPRFFTTTADGGDPTYRAVAAALSPGPGTLIVAIPLTEVSATLDRLLGVELVVSGIALLLVAGFALWLVRLGLRPLAGIGATAGAIAAGDLSRRVEPATERTEVGRLGLALNAMLAQIEAAFEERRASEDRLRRFVADASHELRTPLTSIRGYAELFRRGADSRPEDLAKSMQRIEGEAARMGVLVEDLLLLARLDQGRPLEREQVDLARIVEDAVDSARAVEPDRPIDLELHGPTSVIGDEGRLRQAVDNLLDNARVHTPASSRVRVTLGSDADSDASSVLLSVADEGPGLTSDVATRAFERFYRGDPSRSRSMGGAGLGLSIVAAIVEAHGGTVTVRSEEGAGATFEVRLPVSGRTARVDEREEHIPSS